MPVIISHYDYWSDTAPGYHRPTTAGGRNAWLSTPASGVRQLDVVTILLSLILAESYSTKPQSVSALPRGRYLVREWVQSGSRDLEVPVGIRLTWDDLEAEFGLLNDATLGKLSGTCVSLTQRRKEALTTGWSQHAPGNRVTTQATGQWRTYLGKLAVCYLVSLALGLAAVIWALGSEDLTLRLLWMIPAPGRDRM